MIYNISSRGLLIENNAILFIEYCNLDQETYYSLPGGKQELRIDLAQTLRNEFLEEVGIDIQVGDVILVREFIHETTREELWQEGIHQLEIIFSCTRTPNSSTLPPTKPDFSMTGSRWIPINELHRYKIYPANNILDIVSNRSVHYLLNKDPHL